MPSMRTATRLRRRHSSERWVAVREAGMSTGETRYCGYVRSTSLALRAAVVAAIALAGCDDDVRVPPPRTEAPSPTEGVDSGALAALLVEHWDVEVAFDPLWGTYMGDHRVDAKLTPVAHADVEALRVRRQALLADAMAFDTGALSARDRVT